MVTNRKKFSSTAIFCIIPFTTNNLYSAKFNINGFIAPPIYGTYNLSPIEKKLTLQAIGQAPEFYDISEITSNSFTVNGMLASGTFVRIDDSLSKIIQNIRA
ncbi:MAG: hypothetical protein WCB31_07510 [Nitrososphaeraceae archaeon]